MPTRTACPLICRIVIVTLGPIWICCFVLRVSTNMRTLLVEERGCCQMCSVASILKQRACQSPEIILPRAESRLVSRFAALTANLYRYGSVQIYKRSYKRRCKRNFTMLRNFVVEFCVMRCRPEREKS